MLLLLLCTFLAEVFAVKHAVLKTIFFLKRQTRRVVSHVWRGKLV